MQNSVLEATKPLCRRSFLTGMGCLLLAALECGAMTGFDPDYDAATTRAKERGRPLFVLFTGSDWCVWCKKLEKEVLSQPGFLDVATNAYELVVLDFPMAGSSQTEAERDRNKALMEKFGVEGFPTVLLLDADGVELYRAGYMPVDAKEWIRSFQKGVEVKPLYDKFLKPFKEELQSAVKAFSEDLQSAAPEAKAAAPDEARRDSVKMAAIVKTVTQKHLPQFRSICDRLAAAEVPAELEESKAEMLEMATLFCKQYEGFVEKDVEEIASEFEEGKGK